jgi:uncharacterized protein
MALSYRSPGVYIEEVDRGPKPIQALGTSTAAFLGITAEASRKRIDPQTGKKVAVESCLNRPILVTSWTQFVDVFGDFIPNAYLPDTVYGYFANGGGPCYVTSLRALNEADLPKPGEAAARKRSVKQGEAEAAPEIVEPAPAAITPLNIAEVVGDPAQRTGLGGLEPLDQVRLVLCPDIMVGYDGSEQARMRVRDIQKAIAEHCQRMLYRFAVLDAPPGLNAQQALEWRKYVNLDTSYAALYYPWIKVPDLSGEGKTNKVVPPSGHMVGIYNRSDSDRGVHKAPANEVILGAVDLELNLSRPEQDTLNPEGVNCLRAFPGRGIRVWGGRTLSSNSAWCYINVRRLFIMVESSIDAGLQWVVFEPNDTNLWSKVTRDVTAFLRLIWRSGALFGTTPEQAFYVKCDEELNPPEVRDQGQLIIEVGLAPVKPAEFVIFRITQWAGANAEAS